MTDPAWFYSTLAQSSAAIVGLIGGIIGSRILGQLQQLREIRVQLMAAMREIQRDHRKKRANLDNLIRWWRRQREATQQALDRGDVSIKTMAEPTGWLGEFGGSRDRDVKVVDHQARIQILLDQTLPVFERAYQEWTGEVREDELRDRATVLRSVLPTLEDHRGLYEQDAVRLEEVARQLDRYRQSLIPQSFPVVLGVLGWLSITGVVWPLAFLPGLGDGWSKWTLLMLFVIGLIGLGVAFRAQLNQLRLMGRLHWLTSAEYRLESTPDL